MDILSIKYLFFVFGILFVYQILAPNLRKGWILIASLLFYGSISLILLIALIFSILFNFWIGFSNLKHKIWIAVIVNILLLFCFKLNGSSFLVPIGVSFFTFQGLSFVFDYSIRPKIALINFANYMAFFPQLIAGPIETFDHLSPQLNNLKCIQKKNVFPGISMILKGLVLKFVIANRCGIIVNSFYAEILNFDGWFLLFANFLFTVQILFDFSGYCLIATGVAKIIGIRLSKNFTSPYASFSLSDFWKRWHITLHRWFKSYLFKPLIAKYPFWITAGVVFLLSSIWHGIKFHFITWGIVCIVFLLFDKYCIQKFKLPKTIRWITTFLMVYLSWIPFRIPKTHDLTNLLKLKFEFDNLLKFLSDHTHVITKELLNNISSICEYNNTNLNITYFDFYILILSLLLYIPLAKGLVKLHPLFTSILLFITLSFLGFDNSTPFIYFQF